jgi:hypothetical protein
MLGLKHVPDKKPNPGARALIMEPTYSELVSSCMSENQYPVYPEDDGYDTPKNPYAPV